MRIIIFFLFHFNLTLIINIQISIIYYILLFGDDGCQVQSYCGPYFIQRGYGSFYPGFISRERLIKPAEVPRGTEEKVQMCCYAVSRWAEAYF